MPDNSIYYDLTITYDSDSEENLEYYTNLLREIRKICNKANGNNSKSVIVLYDGIGEKYCQLGYKFIYDIENAMRKLIYKFMAISIGIDWTENSVPREVIDSIKGETKKEKSTLLFDVDFIQLSNFLFKRYTRNDFNKFFDSIKEKSDDENMKISELKEYAPFSNWEKYFSKKVNCDSEYLRTRWEKLYEYRCKIAHCRIISKIEYNELESIYKEVSEKINVALDSIGDIQVTEEDREDLAENISGVANQQAATFISSFNKLSALLQEICAFVSGNEDIYEKSNTNKTNIRMQIQYLCNNKGIIDREMIEPINILHTFRNNLVHSFGLNEISDSDLKNNIDTIEMLIKQLQQKDKNAYEKLKNIDLRKNQDGGINISSPEE